MSSNTTSKEPPVSETGLKNDEPEQENHAKESTEQDSISLADEADEYGQSILPRFSSLNPKDKSYPGVGLFTLLTVAAWISALLVSLLLHGIRGDAPGETPTPDWMGIEALVGSLIWIPVALLAARRSKLDIRNAVSWKWPAAHGWKLFLLGGSAGLFMLMPAVWLQQLCSRFMPKLGTNLILQLENQDPGPHALALISLAVVLAAPIAEELFFRGFAMNGMTSVTPSGSRKGFWPAAIIISFVFAVIHIEPANMAPIFALSIVLCWLQWRSSSVIPPITCHIVYNGVQILAWLTARHSPDFDLQINGDEVTLPFTYAAASIVLLMPVIYGVLRFTAPTQPGNIPEDPNE